MQTRSRIFWDIVSCT